MGYLPQRAAPLKTLFRFPPAISVILFFCFLHATAAFPASEKPGMRLSTRNLQLRFQGGKPLEVWIEVQLVVVNSGEHVPRRAPLYLSSDLDGIVFPSRPRLDEKGFARLKLVIPSPGVETRRRLQGRFTVWVLIDEEDADDTIEGRVVFTYSLGGE